MSSNGFPTDARAIMGLMRIDGVGPARIHRILDALFELGSAPEHLLEYDEASFVDDELLSHEEAAQFLSDEERDWRNSTEEILSSVDVRAIPITSNGYPKHLREKPKALAPPLLFTTSDIAPLELPGIAVAGARDLSEGGRLVTETLTRHAIEKRFAIVSGGARGADSIAHEQAVSQEGKTIVVLAEGILTSRAQQLVQMAGEHDIAVVSTCLPQDKWQTWRAMERNRYILGLSDRLIVIEAGLRGGSLAAGKEALRHRVDTWVVNYEAPPESAAGNTTLIDLGAKPILVSTALEVEIPVELFAIGNWVINDARG